MRTILLPTDFSPASESALSYALGFAKKMSAKLILFNTYPVPVYVTDVPVEATLNEEIKTEAELMLKQLEARVRGMEPGVETETISAWGFAADEIIFNAKEKNADFIVMGTHGAGGLKKLLLGTNTAEVVNKAPCAVLAIPDGFTFKDFKKIAYATNCQEEELPAVKSTAELARYFDAEFTLVHITDGILNKKMEGTVYDAFKQKAIALSGFNNLKADMIEVADLNKGLNDYIINNQVDLLAMGHHKRSFISHLIHPSVSQQMAYHLPSPLLVMPMETEKK